MSVEEPKWEAFRVDPTFDPPGTQMVKLFAFMETFINWRNEIHTDGAPPPKRVHPKPNSTRSRKRRGAKDAV